MRGHAWGIAAGCLVGLIGSAGSCERDNASHCGNRGGHAACTEGNERICDVCEAANDGCVSEVPEDPTCVFGGDLPDSVGDDGSTTTPATSTGGTSTGGTSSGTTGDDGGSSSGGPPIKCPNGTVDEGEECDGDVGDATCASLGLGRGDVTCTEECLFDTMMCTMEPTCGNGIKEPGEQCDGADVPLTCTELDSDAYIGGQLGCTSDCMFDDENTCIPCKNTGASCSDDDQCCGTRTCVNVLGSDQCSLL